MTTQLSSLAVRPDLDPSKFVQGAQQLDAAAAAAGKSVAGVGMASDEVNRKISQAGDVVGRLSRQYVDGYASAQRFQSALNSLSREMEKGNLTIDRAQPILDGIYRKYGLMGDAAQFAAKGQIELANAITSANARIEQQRRIVPANGNVPISAGAQRAAGFNAGQQLQDIVMMSAMGQNPAILALQQGPQLATALEQGGGVTALKAGLMSLLSPTTLVTVGLTAAAAAAVQFGAAIVSRGKSIDDVLKGHKSFIDEITKSFPQAAAAAKQYEDQAKLLPQSVVSADTAQQAKDETERYQKAMRDFRVQFNLLIQGDTGQADFARVGKAGAAKFAEISKGIKTGQIDAIELQRRLGELRLNPDLSKSTQDFYKALQDAVNPAAELERHMQGTAAAVHGIAGGFNGPGGLPAYLAPNAGAYDRNKALSDEQTQLSRMQRSFTADIAGIGARSPLERAGAARLQAAATVNGGETPQERQLRIDLAGQRALLEAEHQLQQAEEQRARSRQQTLASAQLDLSLIGKTTSEVTEQQQAFQMLSALRQEAAQNGITSEAEFQKYYGSEIEQVKQLAAELGKLAQARAAAQLDSDLAFTRDQFFRSPIEQQIASTQRGAGLSVDMNSPQAQAIRQNEQLSELRTASQAFVSTFSSTLQSSGGNIGKAFGAALLAGLQNYEQKAIEQLGDILFKILAGAMGMGPTAGAASGGGVVGLATGVVGKLMDDANDNYAPGAVTSAPLGDILQRSASAIRSMESSGNYSALGPVLASGDRAYGAYQVMGSNVGPWTQSALGSSLTPSQFLANPDAQDAVFQKVFGGYLSKYGPSGAAQAWFGGPGSVGSGGGAADILGTTGASYVAKFNAQLGKAAEGLGTFGTGLGNLGQSLANVFPAAPTGGGGIFGFLGSLFGGGRSLSATAMAAVAAGPGGLYDVGGYTGHGGKYDVAGYVHRGEFVFDADSTARIGVSNLERLRKLPGYAGGGYVRALPYANSNGSGASPAGGMHISIGWARGASGMFEPAIVDVVHREAPDIARRESRSAVAEYSENQRRGGFGELQKRYTSQKG